MGFEVDRFKTGTPPRIHRDTIDYARTREAPGDPEPRPFSHFTARLDVPALHIDAAATLEISQNMDRAGALDQLQLRDYRFRVRLQAPFLYMSLRGLRYDAAGARRMRRDPFPKGLSQNK